MPISRILLATDLSCRCDRALDRATGLAQVWGAQLVVVHALPERELVSDDRPSWRRPVDPREAAWQRVRADLRGAEGIAVDVIVERGEPGTVIVATAERLGCELIVTGVARDETLGRMLLGSTVEHVTRLAAVPTLVVKSRPRGMYTNVVVATDFSEASREALETALALLPEAQISLFHAFDIPFEGLRDDRASARETLTHEAQAQAWAFLEATPAVAASKRFIATICEHGGVESLLADLVQARGVDLVVVGTSGRGGLASLLLGSVAQRLLQRLPVDVLVVRRRRQ